MQKLTIMRMDSSHSKGQWKRLLSQISEHESAWCFANYDFEFEQCGPAFVDMIGIILNGIRDAIDRAPQRKEVPRPIGIA